MTRRAGLREAKLGRLLRQRRLDIAVAESCTGGLVGGRITAVPGSSSYFRGGVIAYDNRVKTRLLGVPQAVLRRHGAVSAETALAMARGVRRLIGTHAAVAVTGVAGPGGGAPEKPVGLVFAAAVAGRRRRWRREVFRGGRDGIRRRSADLALDLLISLFEDGG